MISLEIILQFIIYIIITIYFHKRSKYLSTKYFIKKIKKVKEEMNGEYYFITKSQQELNEEKTAGIFKIIHFIIKDLIYYSEFLIMFPIILRLFGYVFNVWLFLGLYSIISYFISTAKAKRESNDYFSLLIGRII